MRDARPDLFDWPKEIQSRLNRRVPDLVVGMFGGNDAQNMTVGRKTLAYGSAEWDLEYPTVSLEAYLLPL